MTGGSVTKRRRCGMLASAIVEAMREDDMSKWQYHQGAARPRHRLLRLAAARRQLWLEQRRPDHRWRPEPAGRPRLFDLALTGEMLGRMRAAVPAAGRSAAWSNTHSNGDHTFGNQLVAGAEIIASRACAEEMK